MEAPTLCIFQIYSLRLGLLCILDYNKMLSLLPKNISQDWPFPSFTQQEISSSGRVILPLTATGHGFLGGSPSFWAHLRWDVLVRKEAIPVFWISSLLCVWCKLSLSTKTLYDFPVFSGKTEFSTKAPICQQYHPSLLRCPFLVTLPAAERRLLHAPKAQETPQRTVGM